MGAQAEFFDFDERLVDLSTHGDSLERIAGVVDFDVFPTDLNTALGRAERRADRACASATGSYPSTASAAWRVKPRSTLMTASSFERDRDEEGPPQRVLRSHALTAELESLAARRKVSKSQIV